VRGFGESQIYRDLMRFKPDDLSPNAWAVKAGVSRAVWSDMRRHGNPSRRTLEKLLAAAGSSVAEFEALRLGPQSHQLTAAAVSGHLGDARAPWRPQALPPLPLIASSLGGEWEERNCQIEVIEVRSGRLLDRLPRPASLASDADAFAITIVGDAMRPRFRPGMRIAVSPRAPVALGDEVLVRLRSEEQAQEEEQVDRALLAQLVKRSARGFELRQFNLEQSFHVGADEVDAVLKIAGELI
jgi:hypothetical protein